MHLSGGFVSLIKVKTDDSINIILDNNTYHRSI